MLLASNVASLWWPDSISQELSPPMLGYSVSGGDDEDRPWEAPRHLMLVIQTAVAQTAVAPNSVRLIKRKQ